MNSFIKSLKNKTGFLFFGMVSKEKIDDAEKALSVVFSDEYKEYLSTYGCVSFIDHELTGICDSSRLSVVDTTIRERELFPTIPLEWYVIEETNIDDIVIWQDATGAVYQTVPGSQPLKICNSLEDYIHM